MVISGLASSTNTSKSKENKKQILTLIQIISINFVWIHTRINIELSLVFDCDYIGIQKLDVLLI
jgi:hypothetical protein